MNHFYSILDKKMNLRLDKSNIIGGDGKIVSSDIENAEVLNKYSFLYLEE